ncbi:hypothetical protein FTW19_05485 [Terriglobus albidus]|uniref:Uncharacterized protein n=1 Tax=Terriglobus albidus TaxID=1592106 RepID=A0A5B9EA36_9BACT|nr:hypothetical protein [Terriglobus albidus]QEE27510.1 hypothetical protein FTW19_05485 [Terriglobus albidus]
MNTIKSATKWIGGAAMAAVMFFGLSHKAEAQHVSFGVQVGGPVVVAEPAYPYAYAYNGGYYNGYNGYYRDDWRRRQHWEHERWERERHYDRDYRRDYDHDRGRGFDRDHGYGYGYGRR